MATVIVAKRVGRLANRMLLFAHLIGTAAEHGFTVLNPSLYPYNRHFPATARDLVPSYPRPRSIPTPPLARSVAYQAAFRTAELAHRRGTDNRAVGLIRLSREQRLDLDSPEFLDSVARHRVLFLQDWFFRSASNCHRHGDLIRAYFTPHRRHVDQARRSVEHARQKGDALVGVHVRRGDYATFKGGRYFYSWSDYRRLMERVRGEMPQRGVSFLVSTDDRVPAGAFRGLDVIRPPGHLVADLVALSLCDRILGPPSTYNRWASYYGQVPRHVVADLEHSLAGPLTFEVDRALT